MSAAILKHGELLLPAYRVWCQSQTCTHCGRQPPSLCHHWPTRGAMGVVFDLRIVPLCAECHTRAHGSHVWIGNRRLAPLESDKVTLYVAQTWQRFIESAPWSTVETVLADVRRWRESRGEKVPL